MVRMARFAFDDDQDAEHFDVCDSLTDLDDPGVDTPPANATEGRRVTPKRPGTQRLNRRRDRSPQLSDGTQPQDKTA